MYIYIYCHSLHSLRTHIVSILGTQLMCGRTDIYNRCAAAVKQSGQLGFVIVGRISNAAGDICHDEPPCCQQGGNLRAARTNHQAS